jgi:outer membrane protein TolC
LFTEVDVELLQPIWTFGKLSSITNAARLGVEAERAGHEATTADVLVQIRSLFWGLVLGYELQDLVGEVLTEVDNAESTVQTKLDDGADDVSQTDLFKIQVFRYEVEKRQREVLREVEIGKATLRAAMGLDESVDFELATRSLEQIPVTIDSLDAYVAIALDNRPELAQLRAGIAARSAMVDASARDYLPQFYVGAQLKYNRAPGRFDSKNPFVYNPTNFFRPGVVLGMRWNLNLIQTRDIVRTAQIEQKALVQQEPILTEGVRLDVRTEYLALREAEQNILESRMALRASQNWLRSETQTFDLGIGEVKDLIDAYQTHSTMRSEHLQNIFSFNTALARLARAVGHDLYPN